MIAATNSFSGNYLFFSYLFVRKNKPVLNHGKLFYQIIFCEIIGFLIALLFLWLDEYLDLPNYLFGSPPTPINYTESIFEICIIGLLGLFIIIATARLLEKIEYMAMHDPLTGLSNRRFLIETVKNELQRFSRSKRDFSIIMADIDHFKSLNDQHGHECGDSILQNMAEILKENMRSQDLVCRWGGEEFLIFLPDTSSQSARHVAEKLRLKIAENSFSYKKMPIKLTMSFGVSDTQYESLSPYAYIKNADRNLYKAKDRGRNRVI